jgi:hypothetical protein
MRLDQLRQEIEIGASQIERGECTYHDSAAEMLESIKAKVLAKYQTESSNAPGE